MMTQEDKKILEYLTESYNPRALNESVDAINEYLFNTDRTVSSAERTKGMTDKGMPGLLKAVPSAVLTTAIFWPGALLALIGSLSVRAEKYWLKSIFDSNRWLDYISRPFSDKWGKDKDKDNKRDSSSDYADDASASLENMSDAERKKLERQMVKENMKTYYAVMSNDEIFRCRALDENSAKQQFDKMIEFNPYEEMERRRRAGGIVWMVYFNDFEQVLWVAPTKEEAEKEVMMTRKQLDATYAKVGVADPLRQTGLRVVDVKRLKNQEVLRPGTSYKVTEKIPLSYRNVGAKSQEEYYTNQEYNVWTYRMRNSNCIFSYPARSMGEANSIGMELYLMNKKIFDTNERLHKTKKYDYWKVYYSDGDIYIICALDKAEAMKNAARIQEAKQYIILNKKISAVSRLMNKVDVPEIKKVEPCLNQKGDPVTVDWNWRIIVTKSYTKEVTDNTPNTEIKRRAIAKQADNYIIPKIKTNRLFVS